MLIFLVTNREGPGQGNIWNTLTGDKHVIITTYLSHMEALPLMATYWPSVLSKAMLWNYDFQYLHTRHLKTRKYYLVLVVLPCPAVCAGIINHVKLVSIAFKVSGYVMLKIENENHEVIIFKIFFSPCCNLWPPWLHVDGQSARF